MNKAQRRRIFVHKTEEVIGRWRKIHNEALHNLHTSRSIGKNNEIMEDEMGGTCSPDLRDQKFMQIMME